MLAFLVIWSGICWSYHLGRSAIVQAPHTQVILPRQTAAFQCTVDDFGIWYINNTGLDDTTFDRFERMGISYGVVEVQNRDGAIMTNLSLTVEGRAENNETHIQCYSYGSTGSDVQTSPPALLVIAGPPLAPGGVAIESQTPVRLRLSWQKPFTWPEVADILHYTVRFYNSSNQEWRNWTVPSLSQQITYEHYLTASGVAQECTELAFEVSATNSIGSSNYGRVKGGFPISIKWGDQNGTAKVGTMLEYRTDGSVRLTATINPPIMCPYQQAIYNIKISSYYTNVVVAKATVSHLYENGEPFSVPLTFKPAEFDDTEYNVILVVSSLESELQAVTSFNISPTLLPTPSNNDKEPQNLTSTELIAAVVAGSLFVIVFIIALAGISAYVCRINAKVRQSGSPDPEHHYHQPPLPATPATEHIYEHIQDYQKKNSVALMANANDVDLPVMTDSKDFLMMNWQSTEFVTSDVARSSVIVVVPPLPRTVRSANSLRRTVDSQIGDYVEMRMLQTSSPDVPCVDATLPCGPLAAL